MSRHAFITGGTGFVGVHIARALLGRGYEVTCFDMNEPDRFFPRAADFVRGDVCDRAAVYAAAASSDVIVANAALVPVTQAGASEFMRVNAGGTDVTLSVAREIGAYAAYISSSAIFGVPDVCPLPPDAPLRPFEAYGASKAEGERIVRRYRAEGMTVSSLRPRTLVGAGRLGLFEMIFERVRAGKRVPIFGRGQNRVQLSDAQDYAEAVALAIDQCAGGDYNIGAARFGTVRQDIEDLIAAVGSPSRVQPIPVTAIKAVLVPAAALHASPFSAWHWKSAAEDFFFDISSSVHDLGWVPERSNAEAMIAAYLEHVQAPRDAGGSAHRRPLSGAIGRLLRP
jgi:nucleoside-diphosphate-sugar epimerase